MAWNLLGKFFNNDDVCVNNVNKLLALADMRVNKLQPTGQGWIFILRITVKRLNPAPLTSSSTNKISCKTEIAIAV
eukprot:scaffold674484_cov73-Prasinocladus_malaysianus.AAC.1